MRDGIVGTESRSNKFLEQVPGDVPSGSFFDGCEGAIFILWTSPSEMYLRILKASCVIPSFELSQRLELVQPLVIFLAFLAPKVGLFRRAVVAAVEGRSREPALVVVGSPYWSCVVGSADDA